MSESWKWKFSLSILLFLLAVYSLVPTFFDFEERILETQSQSSEESDLFSKIFPENKVNLGLDLRGGLYLELDVDLEKALDNRLDAIIAQVERLKDGSEITDVMITKSETDFGVVSVNVKSEEKESFSAYLRENFADVFESIPGSEKTLAEGKRKIFNIGFKPEFYDYIKSQTLKQAQESVRNRIDRFGVAEAGIQLQGEDRLIVEIPGVKNPDDAIDIIQRTGLLEFKLVDNSVDESNLTLMIAEVRNSENIPDGHDIEITEKINKALKGKIPEDTEIAFGFIVNKDKSKQAIPYLLKSRTDVSGNMLKTAQVGIENNEPFVSLTFNQEGTKNFAELTKNNVGRRIAILLDGMVNTAPVVQDAILSGQARISLGFGSYGDLVKEAESLALILREGALPASLSIATKTVIGPSLGKDSIKKGIYSLLIAAAAVMIFMIVYYKISGVVSTIGLLLNVIFIFAILALLQASLTLPGMAGIVLTLGMAVDANIIIFERMKEEKRAKASPKQIVESGYGNAWSAIFDANITTFIAGVVLFQFGTGPIKGFATTLMIGILTTLFTAVFVTRLFFDFFIFKRKVKSISV